MPMQSSTYIIGIAGGSGSGKTSFIRAMKKEFDSSEVCFVSLDDYYHPRDNQEKDLQGVKNFDLPSSINSELLIAEINKLRDGQVVQKEKYHFNNALKNKETFELKPAPIIFIEGLFIYHYEEIRKLFDLKLYIDTSDELKLIRRIKRDQKERNYPIEDVMYRYENHVMPSYRAYIQKYKGEMDLIINNNRHFVKSQEVIIDHIKSQIRRITASE